MATSHNLFALAALGAMLLSGSPAPAAQNDGLGATCKISSAPATVSPVVPADIPTIALLQGATGNTTVQVTLSETGALETATIAESSGNQWLDKAALSAVRGQKYSPEISGCQPVSGSYFVSVEFNAQG